MAYETERQTLRGSNVNPINKSIPRRPPNFSGALAALGAGVATVAASITEDATSERIGEGVLALRDLNMDSAAKNIDSVTRAKRRDVFLREYAEEHGSAESLAVLKEFKTIERKTKQVANPAGGVSTIDVDSGAVYSSDPGQDFIESIAISEMDFELSFKSFDLLAEKFKAGNVSTDMFVRIQDNMRYVSEDYDNFGARMLEKGPGLHGGSSVAAMEAIQERNASSIKGNISRLFRTLAIPSDELQAGSPYYTPADLKNAAQNLRTDIIRQHAGNSGVTTTGISDKDLSDLLNDEIRNLQMYSDHALKQGAGGVTAATFDLAVRTKESMKALIKDEMLETMLGPNAEVLISMSKELGELGNLMVGMNLVPMDIPTFKSAYENVTRELAKGEIVASNRRIVTMAKNDFKNISTGGAIKEVTNFVMSSADMIFNKSYLLEADMMVSALEALIKNRQSKLGEDDFKNGMKHIPRLRGAIESAKNDESIKSIKKKLKL